MKIYKAKAFTYPDKIESKEVLGNPASVVVCKSGFPSQEKMGEIAVREKQPITVFLKKRDNKDKEFDIRYFFPDGSEVNLCGHGSFVTTKVISQIFNLKGQFNLFFNKNLIKNNKLAVSIDNNNLISINLPKYDIEFLNLSKLNQNLKDIIFSLGLNIKNINSIFKSLVLNDYVFEISNVNILRDLKPNFNKLKKVCLKLGCRTIIATSKSNLKNFDYETRVFVPHSKVNEDIVCGSANCSVASFWSNKLNKSKLKVLYPYHFNESMIGGVQIARCGDYINLIGYVDII